MKKMKLSQSSKRMTARLLVVLALFYGGSGFAHRVKVFATVSGNTIEGSAYFPGGGTLPNADIRIEGPGKELLGTVTTNSKGEFSFVVTRACAHHIILELPDGHSAEFTVPEDALLFAENARGDTAAGSQTTASDPEEGNRGVEGHHAPEISGQLEMMIDAAVARRIKPLELQVERLIDQRRFQDILGGIGYIFGLMGIAFWIGGVARRKAEKTEGTNSDETNP